MERISFHDQINRNKFKSVILIIVVLGVLMLLGYVIGLAMGPDYFFVIMVFAIIFSLSYILIGYYNSDKIALASVKAKPASRERYPQYHHSVEALCLASGLPKPKLYVMEDNNINAFASGRNPENAVLCFTSGALEKFDKHELEGVIGHELSHIANYDIRFMTLTAILVGMIAIISQVFLRSLFWRSIGDRDHGKGNFIFLIIGIILAILAPIVVSIVQLTISRKREYTADASAVKFIRSPTGLISALKKIDDEHPSKMEHREEKARIPKAVAPLFISDPFKRKMDNLFATHPPIKKRISFLEKM